MSCKECPKTRVETLGNDNVDTSHEHHPCTISLSLQHDCIMKMPNFKFVDDVNTKQQLSFPFPELPYGLIELRSRKIYQHLTN